MTNLDLDEFYTQFLNSTLCGKELLEKEIDLYINNEPFDAGNQNCSLQVTSTSDVTIQTRRPALLIQVVSMENEKVGLYSLFQKFRVIHLRSSNQRFVLKAAIVAEPSHYVTYEMEDGELSLLDDCFGYKQKVPFQEDPEGVVNTLVYINKEQHMDEENIVLPCKLLLFTFLLSS